MENGHHAIWGARHRTERLGSIPFGYLAKPKTHKICDKKIFFVTKFDFLVKF